MADPAGVCVRTFAIRTEAEFAQQLLSAEGIVSTLWADDGGGLLVHAPTALNPTYMTFGVQLHVPAEQAERAKSRLACARSDSPGEDTPGAT
jgi:hypothetical protein